MPEVPAPIPEEELSRQAEVAIDQGVSSYYIENERIKGRATAPDFGEEEAIAEIEAQVQTGGKGRHPRGVATEGPSGIELSTRQAFEDWVPPTPKEALAQMDSAEAARMQLRRLNALGKFAADEAWLNDDPAKGSHLQALARKRADQESERLKARAVRKAEIEGSSTV